jgi:flagellar biosynthesis/type III secretory pathway chaperone
VNTKLDEALERIPGILREEVSAYRSLSEVLKEQQQLLVDGRPESFEQTLERQESLLSRVKAAERRRWAAMRPVAQAEGAPVAEYTLTRLIESSPDAGELITLRDELKAEAEAVLALNDQNEYLVNRSLEYIRRRADGLLGLVASGSLYAGDGASGEPARASLVDRLL